MNRKITVIYSVIAVMGIICTVFSALVLNASVYDRESGGKKTEVYFSDKMEKSAEDGVYTYSAILPEDTDGKVIVYDTAHMFLDVTIDGELVYSLTAETGRWLKTTGYCWNVVSLAEEDGGKKIVFKARPAYSDAKPGGSFYYGTQSEVEHAIIGERLLKLFVTCLILIAGVMLLICTVAIKGQGQRDDGLKDLIVFAIMLGMWMVCESQIVELYIPIGTAMVFLNQMTFMLMPQPFLLFLRNLYPNKDSRLWSVCIYFNCAIAVIRMVMQITCLYDLRETLWMTHMSLVCCVICIFLLSLSAIIKKQANKQLKLNIFCIMFLVAATAMELIEYRVFNRSTASRQHRLSVLCHYYGNIQG